MKKLTLIISALALVLGMSQCTKKPDMPVYGTQTQSITFKTGNGGSKGIFQEGVENLSECVLKYKWDNGESKDVVYVYAQEGGEKFESGTYIGAMTLKSVTNNYNAVFEGRFDIPTNGWLRFIHYGQDVDVTNIATTGVSVDFSEQDGSLETISDKVIAIGDVPIDPSGNYECSLSVQFAVMKVNLGTFTDGGYTNLSAVINNGVKVTENGEVNYINGTYSILDHVSSEYYLVLMPIDDTEPLKFCDNAKMGKISKNLPANCYSCGNNHEALTIPTTALSANTLPGVFSVGPRKSAHISKGNLWCNATDATPSNWLWSFENNQWDYNTALTYDASHVNLFMWSQHGNAVDDAGYGAGMTYTKFAVPSITDMVDWSVKMNGVENIWRTPSHEELVALLESRSENLCKYFEFDGGVKGYVILPDCAEKNATTIFSNINNLTNLATYNAVFFPYTGYRGKGLDDVDFSKNMGFYWSLSPYTDDYVIVPGDVKTDYAWAVLFGYINPETSIKVISFGGQYRYAGYSVRLICE